MRFKIIWLDLEGKKWESDIKAQNRTHAVSYLHTMAGNTLEKITKISRIIYP
jgi:hypothetical protein